MKAKKFAAIILCAAMTAASVISASAAETAAVENTETASAAVDSTVVTQNLGEWKTIPNAGISYLTEDNEDILQKALKDSDESFSGVALLGTQVVSGTNYAFLGQTSKDDVLTWSVAVVYQDLEGNVSLTSVQDIDLSKYTEGSSDINFEQLAGGWTVTDTQFEVKNYDEETADNSSAETATETTAETVADAEASEAAVTQSQISEDTAKAFSAATKELLGVSYGPIAEIALQQTDSDTNYAVLCKATSVTAEPASGLAIVVIHKDAEGSCTVSSIAGLDLADFAK